VPRPPASGGDDRRRRPRPRRDRPRCRHAGLPGLRRPAAAVGTRPHPHRPRPHQAPGPAIRRARCTACAATHVLLPAVVGPRRADTTAVIGAALQASARRGRVPGHRRPPATSGVDGAALVRAGRDPAHAAWLRGQALDWLTQPDRDVVGGLRPEPTPPWNKQLPSDRSAPVREQLWPQFEVGRGKWP
jgi:hypothetical protein